MVWTLHSPGRTGSRCLWGGRGCRAGRARPAGKQVSLSEGTGRPASSSDPGSERRGLGPSFLCHSRLRLRSVVGQLINNSQGHPRRPSVDISSLGKGWPVFVFIH